MNTRYSTTHGRVNKVFYDRFDDASTESHNFPNFFNVFSFISVYNVFVPFTMWVFSVVGDDNVRDNMTSLNMSSREIMRAAQIITCQPLATLAASLLEIRLEFFTFKDFR